jgi:hypothetical protein
MAGERPVCELQCAAEFLESPCALLAGNRFCNDGCFVAGTLPFASMLRQHTGRAVRCATC